MSAICELCGGKGTAFFNYDAESPAMLLCNGCFGDVNELFSLAIKDNLPVYSNYRQAFLEDFHNSRCACRLVNAADYKNYSVNQLKVSGKTGYYEYKAISVVDNRGVVDVAQLTEKLNKLGLEGWKLQCAYSNEVGKNALSIGGVGNNSTVDQNILIFERFVNI